MFSLGLGEMTGLSDMTGLPSQLCDTTGLQSQLQNTITGMCICIDPLAFYFFEFTICNSRILVGLFPKSSETTKLIELKFLLNTFLKHRMVLGFKN